MTPSNAAYAHSIEQCADLSPDEDIARVDLCLHSVVESSRAAAAFCNRNGPPSQARSKGAKLSKSASLEAQGMTHRGSSPMNLYHSFTANHMPLLDLHGPRRNFLWEPDNTLSSADLHCCRF